MASDKNQSEIRETVRDGYARIARREVPVKGASACCGGAGAERVAQAVGYTAEELATLPEDANLGLSCGNPTALASLRPGEVVVDLGSGGGFDCFIAGQKVGARGRAIGVDMTQEMLDKARRNAASYRERTGLDNVEFRLGEIEHLPIADATADVVISNCVINLSPDKPSVWGEIARVLRPGGRVAVSDLALLRPLPPAIVETVEALVGCVAGAVLVDETERMMVRAGLADVRIDLRPDYVEAMTEWNDPLYRKLVDHLPPGHGASDYITSAYAQARKPAE